MDSLQSDLEIVNPFPVRCINNLLCDDLLTVGKGYMVVAVSSGRSLYQIRDDQDNVNFFNHARFSLVPLCKKCGSVILLNFHKDFNDKLLELCMCSHCEFWLRFQEDMKAEPRRHFVADGNGYSASPDGSRGFDGKRGFGGARFYVKLNDGYMFTTNNMSHRGDIDLAWKNDLPDNAIFLTEEDYLVELQAREHGQSDL